MKKLLSLTFIFALVFSIPLSAQLRSDLATSSDYTGPIINAKTPTVQNWLNNFFSNKITMSHSYSMNFGSYGGSYQNVNAYTNTMQFAFTDNLTGRLDVSFLHSPFGGSDFVNTNNNLNGEIIVRNAELNYKISDNAHIRLQYQQLPSGYGFYNPYNRFSRSQFDPFFTPYGPWY